MTILIFSHLARELSAGIRALLPSLAAVGGVSATEPVTVLAASSARDLPEDLSDVEVCLCFQLPRPFRERMPRLAWVASTGAGVDRILAADLPDHVRVTRMDGVFGRPLAEYVLAALLAWTQKHRHAETLQRERRFAPYVPEEIRGRTAGILGAGSIGAEIARLLAAAGLRVIGLRRSGAPHPAFERVYGPGELSEFLSIPEYVVVVVPLTAETRGMLGRDEFRAMRPDAVLVNVARGPLVVEPELVAALRDGAIAGAVLDVFSIEPLPATSALWDLPTVRITPHVAGLSRVPTIVDRFGENLRRYLRGEPLASIVDRARGY